MIHFQLLMAVTHLARPRWQSHARRALWCWSHSRHPGQFCAQNNGPAAQEPWRTEGAPPLWANLLWTYRMAGLGDTNWWGGSKAICKWVQRCDTFVWDSGPAQTAANCKCLSIYQTESDMQCDRVQSAKIILQKLPCQEFVPLSSTQSNLFKWKHLRASYEHLTSITMPASSSQDHSFWRPQSSETQVLNEHFGRLWWCVTWSTTTVGEGISMTYMT